MKSNRLKNKNIVITGASSGIGERISFLVAEQGARPILLARNSQQLLEISMKIKENTGVDSLFYKLDVSDTDAVEAVFQEILAEVGTIDVLINNAGFGKFDHAVDATLTETKEMFAVNVVGLIACTKMVLPAMIAGNNGHIINIASQAGKLATPKSSVYSATKHAVLGFTNSLRLEVASANIQVTSVNPGPIRTRFFDIADQSGNYAKSVDRFMLDPDDVARKIVKVIFTPKRELNLPRWMSIGTVLYTLFPTTFEKVGGKALFKK
ncbi:SDR family oxidoreductase [Bacillus sp. PS06]|uniref:SDR family NAD(P)-dependent oxidoreductase n=1 Tax=Bacillus sp. PS06 TaxID=2764176 RepID=UPI00296EDDF6|nr:SDR family oxidoreductase [Bacillus sp. PS06]